MKKKERRERMREYLHVNYFNLFSGFQYADIKGNCPRILVMRHAKLLYFRNVFATVVLILSRNNLIRDSLMFYYFYVYM